MRWPGEFHQAIREALEIALEAVAGVPDRLQAYTREMEIIEKYKRIYYFAKRIAKSITKVEEEAA